MPPDTLNDIGVLKRREIEARILMPLIESLGKEFGREKVLGIVRETIIAIARGQGAALAQHYGSGMNDFAGSLANWKKDNALEIDVLEQNDGRLSFNVTRCRYAEMYRALGLPELGA
ncbi:MAG: L-2-amino-thiazoline-4-carboxylic acid hydrolase, partial [Chloroflexi bacterium]|nr:L-2-amino-thiazoline-4-carboxylic acid hydrolase [Chloroflexota bacterium]